MAQADEALAEYIETQIPTLNLGVNLFIGQVQDNDLIQDRAVFVCGYGGRQPSRTFTTKQTRFPKVQVIVRTNVEETDRSFIEQLFSAIQSKSFGYYQDCKSLQSEFFCVGEDTKKRQIWVCNYELTTSETAKEDYVREIRTLQITQDLASAGVDIYLDPKTISAPNSLKILSVSVSASTAITETLTMSRTDTDSANFKIIFWVDNLIGVVKDTVEYLKLFPVDEEILINPDLNQKMRVQMTNTTGSGTAYIEITYELV